MRNNKRSMSTFFFLLVFRFRYQLLEVIPKTESDVRTIANLPNALGEHLDFWKESRAIDQPTEIFLSPESKSRVVKYLKDNSIAEYRTKIENVGE